MASGHVSRVRSGSLAVLILSGIGLTLRDYALRMRLLHPDHVRHRRGIVGHDSSCVIDHHDRRRGLDHHECRRGLGNHASWSLDYHELQQLFGTGHLVTPRRSAGVRYHALWCTGRHRHGERAKALPGAMERRLRVQVERRADRHHERWPLAAFELDSQSILGDRALVIGAGRARRRFRDPRELLRGRSG